MGMPPPTAPWGAGLSALHGTACGLGLVSGEQVDRVARLLAPGCGCLRVREIHGLRRRASCGRGLTDRPGGLDSSPCRRAIMLEASTARAPVSLPNERCVASWPARARARTTVAGGGGEGGSGRGQECLGAGPRERTLPLPRRRRRPGAASGRTDRHRCSPSGGLIGVPPLKHHHGAAPGGGFPGRRARSRPGAHVGELRSSSRPE